MRTFAHAAISLLVSILVFALFALGAGGLEMLLYWWTSVFDHEVGQHLSVFVLFGLFLSTLVAIASFLLVFHRLHYKQWLPRKAN
jgi:hypothetical protein